MGFGASDVGAALDCGAAEDWGAWVVGAAEDTSGAGAVVGAAPDAAGSESDSVTTTGTSSPVADMAKMYHEASKESRQVALATWTKRGRSTRVGEDERSASLGLHRRVKGRAQRGRGV